MDSRGRVVSFDKDAFLAPDSDVEKVEAVPGMFVGRLSIAGRKALAALDYADGSAALDLTAHLVFWCACDAKGNRLFGGDDLEKLQSQPPEKLAPIAEAALGHNKMVGEAVKDAEKNFDATPAEDSSSS